MMAYASAAAPPTENRVFLGDHEIIEVEVVGRQSPESVRQMGDAIMEHVARLREEGKPILILDDLTRMTRKQPSSVPKAVSAQVKRIGMDRAAMLGPNNVLLKYGSNFIIQAMHKTDSMKYFSDRTKAVQWLLDWRPAAPKSVSD